MILAAENIDLKNIAGQFQLNGAFVNASSYGSGHINDTFSVTMSEKVQNRRYILQRINHEVFKDPKSLMTNIARVTRHIGEKLADQNMDDRARRALTLIPTINGEDFYLDNDNGYWRIYIFIEDATTYDTPQNSNQAYEAARAFGLLQNALIDLPAPDLTETIPHFHNTRQRYDKLMSLIETDPHNRANDVKKEIQFIQDHEAIVDTLIKLHKEGEIPNRITHNDTKLNNVMIDNKTGEGVCVLDLDTVMPGLSLYDYGDCVRSAASISKEDERDLSKAGISLELFEAITSGYLSSAGNLLTNTEIELLPLSARLITLEIGIRFLTDHLAGDIYFKTHRSNHNLDRCRVQLELLRSMNNVENKMHKITATYT